MKKIALFADVQNLYYTVRQAHGCHFNYSALWAEVSRRGTIVEAYAYAIERARCAAAAVPADSAQPWFHGEAQALYPAQRRLGQGRLGRGHHHRRAGRGGRVDEVVLASGDGDFDLLLERVRAGGAEATAYGVPGLTAQSLIRAATRYVPIEGDLLLRG